jgi:hypothetical protein
MDSKNLTILADGRTADGSIPCDQFLGAFDFLLFVALLCKVKLIEPC